VDFERSCIYQEIGTPRNTKHDTVDNNTKASLINFPKKYMRKKADKMICKHLNYALNLNKTIQEEEKSKNLNLGCSETNCRKIQPVEYYSITK
jgi:hypothetical protein